MDTFSLAVGVEGQEEDLLSSRQMTFSKSFLEEEILLKISSTTMTSDSEDLVVLAASRKVAPNSRQQRDVTHLKAWALVVWVEWEVSVEWVALTTTMMISVVLEALEEVVSVVEVLLASNQAVLAQVACQEVLRSNSKHIWKMVVE